jgi:hypothetical protein
MTDVTSNPANAAEAAPSPQPSLVASGITDANRIPTFGVDETTAMANELIKQGVDPERVKAAMRASGYEPGEDARNAAECEFDATFGAAASPSDYKINYTGRWSADADPTALVEFNQAAKEWLSAIGFPAELGASVVETALDVSRRLGSLSADDQKVWADQQESLLTQYSGKAGGSPADMRKIADKVLEFAPKELTGTLRISGALTDAGVIMQLALQGQRMAYRGGLRSS